MTILLAVVMLAFSCKRASGPDKIGKQVSTLARIQQEGVLRVATEFNSTSYFVYRGQPMGFQYEMLQQLADYMGVKLVVTPVTGVAAKFELLDRGNVDLVAANLTVTRERRQRVSFLTPHMQTRQVLVQRKYEGESNVGQEGEGGKTISQPLELGGKTVHVVKNSSYASRLRHLAEEIGDSIHIVEEDQDVEALIKRVARGDIGYTVCDENIAQVNTVFYPGIDIGTPLSFYQNLAWAVRKGDADLRQLLDTWMENFTSGSKYQALYRKYYQNKRFTDMVGSGYYANLSGVISPYDELLKAYGSQIGWDWKLLASLVYQESRFNPQARSWAGAFGIMQLMPNTARRFGVDYNSPIRQQVRAGVMLIEWLDGQLADVQDSSERQKFVVAAYNTGLGHVQDARRLAATLGMDPGKWDNNVAECILKKQEPEYYNRPEIKYGYCRGSETYRYVADIFDRYNHYHNVVR